MKRKIFNLFLIILMAFVFNPIVGHAETKPTGAEWVVEDEIWYKIDGTTLTIGGSGEMPNWNNTSGDSKNYKNAPWYNKSITNIIIDEGITRIGHYSFYDSNNLVSLKIGEDVEEIGIQAFRSTGGLLTIEFGEKLKSIGLGNFSNAKITSLRLPEGLKTIDQMNFQNNNALTKIVFPSTLESIGANSFLMNETNALREIVSYRDSAPNLELPQAGNFNTFKNVNIAKLTIPNGSFESYKSWSICTEEENVSYLYNVVFNENGGTPIKSIMVEPNDKLVQPTNPTKNGYTFVGWYQDITLNVPFDFNTPITSNVTLYAKWKANEYKVTFDANEGTVTPSNKNVTYDSTYGELPVPTRTGYTFEGWYTAKDSGTEVKSDTTVAITEAQTLYAKWKANEYNIIITVNDEDMGTASADLSKAIESTNVSLTSLAKTGYHFVKWESEDVTITNNKFTMPTKNVTIKAIFEEDEVLTYKVSFNKNGGTGSMDDVTGLTGTYTLPENEFVAPEGKQFKGWSLSNDGEIVTELNIDEDKIVYAIWEDIPEDYSYEFKKGDKQELTIDNIDGFTFTIDGDYSLFDSLKIGNLDLIKDEDYIVTEGSTIITFTNKGIAKLNTLEKGTYDILVTYSNGKNVTGSLTLNKILPQEPDTPNPKTGDNISYYIIIGITSLLGLIGSAFYVRKKLY